MKDFPASRTVDPLVRERRGDGTATDDRSTDTRLNVLMLCHEMPPIGGGASAVCHALAGHYARAGHKTCILTMGHGDLEPSERIDDFEIHRVPCGRKRKDMASPWEGLVWARRTLAVANRLNQQTPFDVVHSHFIMPAGIVGARFKAMHQLPLIITPHGSDVPGFNRERLKAAHFLARPWWRRICRQADWIVSPSASLAGLIRHQLPAVPIQVIPNGFETNRFRPRAKEKRILLCSRLVARKGFQYFLSAIRSLDLAGWQVDIVGDGPMHAELSQLAKQCRTPVSMHGWLDNHSRELAALYERAMIFALPSERENCSIALLEAMSAGCAVITTDSSGNPEVVGDCGHLVPVGDIEALRQAVVGLVGDSGRCEAMGRRAAARVRKEFDWRVIAQRYLHLFTTSSFRREAA